MWLTIGIMAGVAGTSAVYTKGDPITSIGSALASGAAVQTLRHPFKTAAVVAPRGGLVRYAGAKVGSDIWKITKAFAGTTTGAVSLGYVAGTAIGTGIVTSKFGWDPGGPTLGGKDALGFYTGGLIGPRPTLKQLATAYEYAPQTGPGKYLQYFPNITWAFGRRNIAYL